MPEGPEVRTITESLNKKMVGLDLESIGVDSKSRYGSSFPGYERVRGMLPAKIEQITCKGKLIIMCLYSYEEGRMFYMTSFLGMTGSWIWNKEGHSNMWLELKGKDGKEIKLYYNDPRHMGRIDFYFEEGDIMKKLNKMGRDLLQYAVYKYNNMEIPEWEDITIEMWKGKIRNKRIKNKEICDFLLEQKQFTGIGNYLRSEILYKSKIAPQRKLESLNDGDIEILYEVTIQTIYEAYCGGGLTIKNYIDPDGNVGKFIPMVYGTREDPKGNEVHTYKDKNERTVWWVPSIQI